MKKGLLKKVPVWEANAKDVKFLELCRQQYLMKVQKEIIEHKRILVLNLYEAEQVMKKCYRPLCRIFFSKNEFLTQYMDENQWSVRTLDELRNRKDSFIEGIAIRTCKEENSIKQFFSWKDKSVESLSIIKAEQYRIKSQEAEKRRKKRNKTIKQLFHTVKPVTKTFEKWLESEVLKESQYIYYEYSRKKKIRCICSHCKSEYQMESSIPKHNKEYICPVCKRKSIFKANGKTGRLFDEKNAIKIEKIPTGIVLRHFCAEKYYESHAFGKYEFSYKEDYRVVFGEKCKYYYKVFDHDIRGYMWREKHIEPYFHYRYHLPHTIKFHDTITQMPGMLYARNLKAALKGTKFQYCVIDDFVKRNPTMIFPVAEYLKTYLRFPLLEQMVKENLDYFALQCLWQCPQEFVNKKETKLRKLLELNARSYSILKKYNLGIEEWHVLKKMEFLELYLSEKEILAYCKIFNNNESFLELRCYATIRKIVNYIGKQIARSGKGKAYTLSSDVSFVTKLEQVEYQNYLSSWKDYIGWAKDLKYNLKSEYVLFPKNFQKVHDQTAKAYEQEKDKREKRKLRKQRNVVNQLLKKDAGILEGKIQDKDYILMVPRNWQDLRMEGETLGHCVGGYVPYIAERQCDVYFIRKKSDPEKPFFTIDWRNGRIAQCQGKGRIRYPEEMNGFMNYAEKQIKLLKEKEEIRLAA